MLHTGDNSPVTFLGFRQEGQHVALFVVSTNSVASYITTQGNHREELDHEGCDLRCAVMNELDHSLVVGMSEVTDPNPRAYSLTLHHTVSLLV